MEVFLSERDVHEVADNSESPERYKPNSEQLIHCTPPYNVRRRCVSRLLWDWWLACFSIEPRSNLSPVSQLSEPVNALLQVQMHFIPFGETQEIVGAFQVEAAVRSKPCSSCSSLKLRCFEPALSGCFLKIPEPELFHHHTLHTTHTCKTPQYSFNPAPFVSCFNFSTAFPQGGK